MVRPRKWRCPICRLAVTPQDPEFPFCSSRCRTQDLANWSQGKYTISSPLFDPDGEEKIDPHPPESDEIQ